MPVIYLRVKHRFTICDQRFCRETMIVHNGHMSSQCGPTDGLARSTYHAYRTWALEHGNPLPRWEDLPESVRQGWIGDTSKMRVNLLLGPELKAVASLPPSTVKDFVYFIRASSGPIKIGSSLDPRARLRALQIGSPVRLRLMAVVPCSPAQVQEMELHRRFGALRSHGEWFRPGRTLLAYIEQFGQKII